MVEDVYNVDRELWLKIGLPLHKSMSATVCAVIWSVQCSTQANQKVQQQTYTARHKAWSYFGASFTDDIHSWAQAIKDRV